jgi:hypothetical protein
LKRKQNSRQGLSTDARLWLDGSPCGFFEFKPTDELEALWNEYPDQNMFWRPTMSQPITLEALAAREDSWLHSGTGDPYGFDSYFIASIYTDAEKQSLWKSRGVHERFHWTPSMWQPEPKRAFQIHS